MLIGVLFFSGLQIGKISRDEELLKEVMIIGDYIKNEEFVEVDQDTYVNWSFQFYLLRHFGVQLDPKNKFRKYFITKISPALNKEHRYTRISLPTMEYKLYKLN
jgi:hypothetical protein